MGYAGSFATRSDLDQTEIHLANGALIKTKVVKLDEAESVKTLGRLQLGKVGIEAAKDATSTVTEGFSQ